MNSIHVVFAEEDHAKFADEICRLIYESALRRGTGIAKRSPGTLPQDQREQRPWSPSTATGWSI